MATYTSNYGWTKPSGSDNVDISVLNDNLDDQDSTIHNAFLNMAPPFSESSAYAVDAIVLYGTGLYKCHTAVVTPGSWTGSTNWQVYKLSEGGGGGLTLGETSSTAYRGDRGKTAYDHSQTTGNPHGTTAADVGLGNVPNVSTNDQEPTFTEASTRNNIASGEKLSVILGKVQKFFNDLKTVAFSGSYTDLSSQPQINSNTLSGNKTTSDLGINADNVMMSDGVTSVEDALDAINDSISDNSVFETLHKSDLLNESTKDANITVNRFDLIRIKNLPIGRLLITFTAAAAAGSSGMNLGTLKYQFYENIRPIKLTVDDNGGVPGAGIYLTAPPTASKAYGCVAGHTYILDTIIFLKADS